MKDLELTVYPRRGRETYVLPRPRLSLGAVAVDRISQAKRLTDAELAAEWHRSAAITGIHGLHADGNRTAIIERFATFPHAAECGYE